MTVLRVGSATDVGRRRKNNEDALLVDDRLFVVADGMGGHAGGEVASTTAVEALRAAYRGREGADELVSAFEEANRAVLDRAASDPNLRGMGTTLVAAALIRDGESDLFAIANVGDSRIYLFRDGEITQLSEDHNVVAEMVRSNQITAEEAATHPNRNMITRAVGQHDEVEPDLQQLIPYRGDRLLLCSDGLTDEVDDAAVASVLRRFSDPDEAARQLVDLANENGGVDNISVVVVDVVDDDDRSSAASAVLAADPPRPSPSDRTSSLLTADERDAQLRAISRDPSDRPVDHWGSDDDPDVQDLPSRRVTFRVVLFIVLVLVVLGGAFYAIGWYARGSYYVGFDNGRVAIFQGRPGGLLWFKPSVKETTAITQASVPASQRSDLESGKEEPTLTEARRYVQNLEEQVSPDGNTGTTETTTVTTDTTIATPAVTGAPPTSAP